jgi:TPR repeat protein
MSASAVAQTPAEAARILSIDADGEPLLSLGSLAYERGNYSDALEYFQILAEKGIAKGQYNLGIMFYAGQGVPQNYAEASRWYRLAADQGIVNAQYNLGFMYYKGEGLPENYAEAARWYRLAAEQGSVAAQINLGTLYAKGEGVSENYVEAYKWWVLAAAQGEDMAKQKRDFLRDKMTPAQIAEAQKLAAEWKPTK